MRLINVGVDAAGLANGKHASGLERYTSSLLIHLASRAEVLGLRLFLYFAQTSLPAQPWPNSPLAKLQPGKHIHWRFAPIRRGWYRLGMGLAMNMDRLDVFHFPAPHMAIYCPKPAVVTFHDLAALSENSNQTLKERRYLPDAIDAGTRATSLIAVSQSAGAEVRQYLGRQDVTVIPEGVDLSKFSPAPESQVRALRERMGLDRYILCVGTLQARKNHIALIRAFEKIQDKIPHSLVLVGGNGSGAEAVHGYVAEHPNPRVRLAGYAEESLLSALYTGADLLALPSLWEGFGLPLVEAMACGTPVLTSNLSSLAEIAERAALLVNPRDVDDIAAQMLIGVTDTEKREQLIAAGFNRARGYSWEHAAEQTATVYWATAHDGKRS